MDFVLIILDVNLLMDLISYVKIMKPISDTKLNSVGHFLFKGNVHMEIDAISYINKKVIKINLYRYYLLISYRISEFSS